jgi:hypothetical protein
VVIGAVWTVWHLPFYFITGTIQQEVGLWSRDFWFDMTARIPLAVLFAWVYLNTNHSILVAIRLHAVDDVASVVIAPEGDQFVVRLVVTIGLTIVAVGLWGARTFARRPRVRDAPAAERVPEGCAVDAAPTRMTGRTCAAALLTRGASSLPANCASYEVRLLIARRFLTIPTRVSGVLRIIP